MSENFTLRWNDFHVGVADNFRKFRNAEDFYDVTLVSDDQQQVSAHKLVLSACSVYFKNIFKHNNKPNSHPLLCLDGISSHDLNNIMDYISIPWRGANIPRKFGQVSRDCQEVQSWRIGY